MFKGDSYKVDWDSLDEILDHDGIMADVPASYDISERRLGAILPRRTPEEISDESRWYDWWVSRDPLVEYPADLDRLDESLDPEFLRFDPEGDPEYRD
jgi:hypothetical protein